MIRVAILETGEIKSIRAEDFDEAIHLKVSADATAMDAASAPEGRAQVTGLTEADVVRIAKKAAAESEKSERTRIEQITALGSKFNASDKASRAIGAGVSFAEFREELWLAGDEPVVVADAVAAPADISGGGGGQIASLPAGAWQRATCAS